MHLDAAGSMAFYWLSHLGPWDFWRRREEKAFFMQITLVISRLYAI